MFCLCNRPVSEFIVFVEHMALSVQSLQRRIAEYSDVATKESYSVISVTVDVSTLSLCYDRPS